MILLKQASPIVNGAPAFLYHYGDPSGCHHSPSSDNKQWPHGHMHWSFYSWRILKMQGQSMGLWDRHPIHLQWVPSHVGLLGNEVADDLAKAATSNPVDPENHIVLTSTEIYCRAKELICRTWVPVHPWYFQRHPGSAISFKGSR
ncbi:RNase H domain-containing protein [Trichonephila clavipes]|nr:RNase H domain-containing protein [Trichonephila clavipes]